MSQTSGFPVYRSGSPPPLDRTVNRPNKEYLLSREVAEAATYDDVMNISFFEEEELLRSTSSREIAERVMKRNIKATEAKWTHHEEIMTDYSEYDTPDDEIVIVEERIVIPKDAHALVTRYRWEIRKPYCDDEM